MDSFTLLYLLYTTKLGFQLGIKFLSLAHPNSLVIMYLATCVMPLAAAPTFHTIVHFYGKKSLSYPYLTAYLCLSFVSAVIWYTPIRRTQDILPFILVTVLDTTTLSIAILHLLSRKRKGDRKRKDEEARTDTPKGKIKGNTKGGGEGARTDIPSMPVVDRSIYGGPFDRALPVASQQPHSHRPSDDYGVFGRNTPSPLTPETAIRDPIPPGGHDAERGSSAFHRFQQAIRPSTTGPQDVTIVREVDSVPISHCIADLEVPIPIRMEDIHPALRPKRKSTDSTPRQSVARDPQPFPEHRGEADGGMF